MVKVELLGRPYSANDDPRSGKVCVNVRITVQAPVRESELGPACKALVVPFAFGRDHEPDFTLSVPRELSDEEATRVVNIFHKYYVLENDDLRRILAFVSVVFARSN